MENAVGGDGLKAARIGEIEKAQCLAMALPGEVALNFDEGSVFAEKRGERIDGRNIGGEGDQTLERLWLVEAMTQPVPLRVRARPGHPRPRGQEAAQISVTLTALHEQGDKTIARQRHFGAHDGPHTGLLRGLKEPGRPREAIAIRQTHNPIPQPGRVGDQIFRA